MSQEKQTSEEILYKYYKTWFNKTFAGAISENLFRETATYPIGIAAMEEYATLKLQEKAKEIESRDKIIFENNIEIADLVRSRDDVFHELEGCKEHNNQLAKEIERLRWFEEQFKRQLRRKEQLSKNSDYDYGVGDLD
jgi:hypothetical protein